MTTTTDRHTDPGMVTPEALHERILVLTYVPQTYAEAMQQMLDDPRCGCGEDGEGGKCAWDDVPLLEELYAHSMAVHA